MALKTPQVYLILQAVLLLLNFLFFEVTCKPSGSITNSSLMIQPFSTLNQTSSETDKASFYRKCGGETCQVNSDGVGDDCCKGYECENGECERECRIGFPCDSDKDCCLKLVCVFSIDLGLVCAWPLGR